MPEADKIQIQLPLLSYLTLLVDSNIYGHEKWRPVGGHRTQTASDMLANIAVTPRKDGELKYDKEYKMSNHDKLIERIYNYKIKYRNSLETELEILLLDCKAQLIKDKDALENANDTLKLLKPYMEQYNDFELVMDSLVVTGHALETGE